MNGFKKMAISFGLVSIITLQGLQANEPKECESDADKVVGCVNRGYFTNGEIRSETPYKNGKPSGIAKLYHDDGKIKSETPYKNGYVDGIAKEYYKNGKLKHETPWKYDEQSGDSKRDGIEKEYYENGNPKEETPYKNGDMTGIQKWYHENGKLRFERSYEKGELNGIYREYHTNGKLKDDGKYAIFGEGSNARSRSSKMVGDRKFYTEDGKLLGTMIYKQGSPQFVKCANKKITGAEADKLMREATVGDDRGGLFASLTPDSYKAFKKYCK